MSRALRLACTALESSGELGVALVASMVALRWLWMQARKELP
jgi:hypothetical protein